MPPVPPPGAPPGAFPVPPGALPAPPGLGTIGLGTGGTGAGKPGGVGAGNGAGTAAGTGISTAPTFAAVNAMKEDPIAQIAMTRMSVLHLVIIEQVACLLRYWHHHEEGSQASF